MRKMCNFNDCTAEAVVLITVTRINGAHQRAMAPGYKCADHARVVFDNHLGFTPHFMINVARISATDDEHTEALMMNREFDYFSREYRNARETAEAAATMLDAIRGRR